MGSGFVKLLLDTHIFLCWLEKHSRLPDEILAAVSNPENQVLVSAASLWEISTKYRLGKLPLPCSSPLDLPRLVLDQQMDLLSISPSHAALAGSWAIEHRDPFDRMLAAQAKIESFILVTLDPVFKDFKLDLMG